MRAVGDKLNPKAFGHQNQLKYREAIFDRSISHSFTNTDFKAIGSALHGDLCNDSNTSSWNKIYDKFGGEAAVWARLASGKPLAADALDDLGSDAPDFRVKSAKSYSRDERVRQAVLRRAKGKCEYCGSISFKRPDGSRYLECHHIIALADEGEDRMTNVIALCPNDHRAAHFGVGWKGLEKRMIAIVRAKAAEAEKR